jgi:hypothetical protein
VEKMPEERILKKKVFKNILERKSPLRKPRNRWLDAVETYLKEMGDIGWRRMVRVGRLLETDSKGARILHGSCSLWRRRNQCLSMDRTLLNCAKFSKNLHTLV